jgi:hypothetical protein
LKVADSIYSSKDIKMDFNNAKTRRMAETHSGLENNGPPFPCLAIAHMNTARAATNTITAEMIAGIRYLLIEAKKHNLKLRDRKN